MIKVLIVDDHEIIREGLKRILSSEPDMIIAGEADNGNDVMKILSEIECDLVLLDLNIPGRNGIDLISEIKKKKPKIQILVVSINAESKFAIPALKAGASGYLSKDSALSELMKAIRKVLEKRRYMSISLAEQLAFDTLVEDSQLQKSLTNKEYCVMLMLASGKENKEVSKELNMSINTVAQCRRNVLEKLRLKNNVQVAHYVLENQLVLT